MMYDTVSTAALQFILALTAAVRERESVPGSHSFINGLNGNFDNFFKCWFDYRDKILNIKVR